MGNSYRRSFCRMQSVRMVMLGFLAIILLGTTVQSHTIHKRHDIIESASSIDKVNSNAANGRIISSENEAPFLSDDVMDVDDIQSAQDGAYSVETNNVNNLPVNVTTTTDVNNGIEQNFGSHNNGTTVVETISASNLPSNFTKEFSQQESVENRLPSKSSDKSSSRAPARVTTVSLKDSIRSATNQESHLMSSLPRDATSNVSEKPKRLDTSFIRSTERAIRMVDTSTVPVSRSTLSNLSTVSLTPKVTATETIRARISSISPEVIAEKRAKYLSDSHIRSSSPSSITIHPEASWSDLKTVGEVHHNNVTLGKSLPQEESIATVNGKIDSEEVVDKGTVEASSTEKITDEHETQLQKSNSSRIGDVDNSLSSFPFTSNRPATLPVTTTTKSIHKKPIAVDEVHQKVNFKGAELSKTKNVNADFDVNVPRVTEAINTVAIPSSTEKMKIEESTMKEMDIFTTTEGDETTTMDLDETTTDETTTLSQQETTTISVKPNKMKENLVAAETTTIIPTTEDKETPTKVFPTTTKDDENKQESTQSFLPKEVANATAAVPTSVITTPLVNNGANAATPAVTKSRPTKPFVTKTTENMQKIITSKSEITSTTTSTEQTVTKEIPPQNEVTKESTDAPEITSTTQYPDTKPPVTDTMHRKVPETHVTSSGEHQTEIASVPDGDPTDINAMIAIVISVVAVISSILLVGLLYVMRKRQKQLTYSQRCRPIGLDAYSLDNISIYNSVRRKSAIRSSKRAFGNAGFDDPGLKNNPLNISQLATFSQKRVSINEEFRDIPTVTARIEEVPIGCEDKNRYANVVPLPESRVHLKQMDDDEKTEYINANFVKGPKDTTHYYIACQAPLEHTVVDFWRMIWEQNSRVIIMATDLTENGIEKCAEYLPSSFVIDNHVTFGDYQITLKNREVRDKYAVSTVHLKNACTKTWREITHFWYQWPENGVPTDEASVIAMLLEARSYLKMVTPEQSSENGTEESVLDGKIANGNLDKTKSLQRIQGPLTVHCSPGTGRTGTIISCDIAIRSLEQPTRTVDIPQIVYFVRRGRASAVQTREQYEFIYKVAHVYATKSTGPSTDN